MQTIRTRIARLAAASAVAVSLGALAAGPAAAQSGVDAPSHNTASVAGTDTDWYFTFPADAGHKLGHPINLADHFNGLYFHLDATDVTFGNSIDDPDKVRTESEGDDAVGPI